MTCEMMETASGSTCKVSTEARVPLTIKCSLITYESKQATEFTRWAHAISVDCTDSNHALRKDNNVQKTPRYKKFIPHDTRCMLTLI